MKTDVLEEKITRLEKALVDGEAYREFKNEDVP